MIFSDPFESGILADPVWSYPVSTRLVFAHRSLPPRRRTTWRREALNLEGIRPATVSSQLSVTFSVADLPTVVGACCSSITSIVGCCSAVPPLWT